MFDVSGKIISLILCFILLIIAPLTIISVSEDMTARRSVLNEVSAFIDEVIDTKVITPTQLANFNLGISSYGLLLDATVTREKRITEPDPTELGSTYTRYIPTSDITKFDTGDIIKVTVKQIGNNGRQRFIRSIVRLSVPKFNFVLAGRVR
jgi:hypothetical protein